MPKFIDPVFAKTSPKRSLSLKTSVLVVFGKTRLEIRAQVLLTSLLFPVFPLFWRPCCCWPFCCCWRHCCGCWHPCCFSSVTLLLLFLPCWCYCLWFPVLSDAVASFLVLLSSGIFTYILLGLPVFAKRSQTWTGLLDTERVNRKSKAYSRVEQFTRPTECPHNFGEW